MQLGKQAVPFLKAASLEGAPWASAAEILHISAQVCPLQDLFLVLNSTRHSQIPLIIFLCLNDPCFVFVAQEHLACVCILFCSMCVI